MFLWGPGGASALAKGSPTSLGHGAGLRCRAVTLRVRVVADNEEERGVE